ncbi:MAG TPA: glycosyltransferase [Blastocatellia bacterium]|nr:glycosyltransferase [Blastocatellia bacterium]
MKRVTIGIHVCSEPDQLHHTLTAVRANTPPSVQLMLFPDGPDPDTEAALSTLSGLPQFSTREARGAAAAFNRLAAASDADLIVFLESGSLPGPGWLERLSTALTADPRHGLAGPTTNLAWNEQCAYPNSDSTPAGIARTAQQALVRFGQEVRTLEPLYSLADFCYAVRREVIDAIGAADESYRLGPCWEMDYNIRAMRTGYRGIWVCGAYVHRLPFTARRSLEERRHLEASKRRYQDNFCGARLRGEKTDYRAHCRGDACPNFAPAELIRIDTPLSAVVVPAVPWTPRLDAPPRPDALEAVPRLAAAVDPIVSCIMPTFNRRSFVLQAIRCFFNQDYGKAELVIIDDGSEPVGDCLPEDDRIRYVRLDRRLTIGAKRNLACAEARGEFIVHWDDDDWYPPRRVSTQVRAMLDSGASICGSSRIYYFDPLGDRAFEYVYRAPGPAWVGGNTLAYRKSFWEAHNFSDDQIGEDSRFVWSASNTTTRDLGDPTLCVAMIHSGNTSPKQTNGPFWQPQPRERIRELLGDELHFYRAFGDAPLVSCIMPTCNRRPFVKLALESFLRQDYPKKELVIVDDGDAPVEDLVSNLPDARYVRLPGRLTIGAKRNLACEQARGEIVAHWDDDDWYSPDRIRYQAAPIISGEADITGLENAFVLELSSGEFWSTQPALHRRAFVGDVHGGTIVFRKQLLMEGLRYPEVNLAEDAWLVHRSVSAGKRLLRMSNPGLFIYVRHGTNAWREFAPGRFLDPAGWQQIARPATLPPGVVDSYQAAGRIG